MDPRCHPRTSWMSAPALDLSGAPEDLAELTSNLSLDDTLDPFHPNTHAKLLSTLPIPPAFSLPHHADSDDALLSSGDPRSPAPTSLIPRTPITSLPPPAKTVDHQLVNMLQEKMKEAAAAAIVKTAANATPAAAATGE